MGRIPLGRGDRRCIKISIAFASNHRSIVLIGLGGTLVANISPTRGVSAASKHCTVRNGVTIFSGDGSTRGTGDVLVGNSQLSMKRRSMRVRGCGCSKAVASAMHGRSNTSYGTFIASTVVPTNSRLGKH